jgi:hypothetical protein
MDDNDPRDTLNESILTDIRSRINWERKQVDYYRARHNGIARQNKPWPKAADLHFPLIDTNIEKLKPLFFQQIVGMDVVAQFVPFQPQMAAATSTAERLFDYKLREKSNLQDEALSWIDWTLMSGRGVMKVTWNGSKGRLDYTAIDPMYIVVPQHTKDLQDADRIVHIMPMSVDAYKRAGIYNTDDELLKKIKGDGVSYSDSGHNNLRSARRIREGLTHDKSDDKIIVWEVYERQQDGGWVIYTWSPNEPDIDLRDPMMLPYDHGMAPFVDFAYEIKDKGWYSPRGIAEIMAPFESYLCYLWNQKADAMQLYNKPLYRAEREVPNTLNLRLPPGGVLPYGIAPVQQAQPPISFDQDMIATRSIAEQRVANPDYGIGQLTETKNRRTATEVDAISAQSAQAGDLRARIFRMALGKLYKMSWSLLMQFDRDTQYRFLGSVEQMDPAAMHDNYFIEPKGGANEVNKDRILQRLFGYKQAFAQSPWIDQSVIDRQILATADPDLVPMAFHDPNLKQQDEVTDETRNIPALLIGGQIPVKKGDDYHSRVGVLMSYLQAARQKGQMLPPDGTASIVSRLGSLLQYGATVDNNGAKALAKSVEEFLRSAGFIQPPPPPANQALPVAA